MILMEPRKTTAGCSHSCTGKDAPLLNFALLPSERTHYCAYTALVRQAWIHPTSVGLWQHFPSRQSSPKIPHCSQRTPFFIRALDAQHMESLLLFPDTVSLTALGSEGLPSQLFLSLGEFAQIGGSLLIRCCPVNLYLCAESLPDLEEAPGSGTSTRRCLLVRLYSGLVHVPT